MNKLLQIMKSGEYHNGNCIYSFQLCLCVWWSCKYFTQCCVLGAHEHICFSLCVPPCPCYLLAQKQMADANNDDPVTESSAWISSIRTANTVSFQLMQETERGSISVSWHCSQIERGNSVPICDKSEVERKNGTNMPLIPGDLLISIASLCSKHLLRH